MLTNSARKRAKKNRRAKKPNKKMVLDVFVDAEIFFRFFFSKFEFFSREKPENVERLEKRKTRFVNEPTTSQIKPVSSDFSSKKIDRSVCLFGTFSRKLGSVIHCREKFNSRISVAQSDAELRFDFRVKISSKFFSVKRMTISWC